MTKETFEEWAAAARSFGAHMERDATGIEEYRDQSELPASPYDIVRGLAVLVVVNQLPDGYEIPFILELAKYQIGLGNRVLGPLDSMIKATSDVPGLSARSSHAEIEDVARRIAGVPSVDPRVLEALRDVWQSRINRYAGLFQTTKTEVRSWLQAQELTVHPSPAPKAGIQESRTGCIVLLAVGLGLIGLVMNKFG